jgi:hypothetical protein
VEEYRTMLKKKLGVNLDELLEWHRSEIEKTRSEVFEIASKLDIPEKPKTMQEINDVLYKYEGPCDSPEEMFRRADEYLKRTRALAHEFVNLPDDEICLCKPISEGCKDSYPWGGYEGGDLIEITAKTASGITSEALILTIAENSKTILESDEKEKIMGNPETIQDSHTQPMVQQDSYKDLSSASAVTPLVANSTTPREYQDDLNVLQEPVSQIHSNNSVNEQIKNVDQKYIPSEAQNFKDSIGNVKRDNYTYIPSSENIFVEANKSKEEFKVNKYIPSQLPGKFQKTFDNSGLEAVLRRADRAEQMAIQVLSGQFKG